MRASWPLWLGKAAGGLLSTPVASEDELGQHFPQGRAPCEAREPAPALLGSGTPRTSDRAFVPDPARPLLSHLLLGILAGTPQSFWKGGTAGEPPSVCPGGDYFICGLPEAGPGLLESLGLDKVPTVGKGGNGPERSPSLDGSCVRSAPEPGLGFVILSPSPFSMRHSVSCASPTRSRPTRPPYSRSRQV